MSQRRRHQGLSQIDLHQIEVSLGQVVGLTIQSAAITVLALRAAVLLIALPLLQGINQMFTAIYQALDPINPANKNRLIASYTEEESWYLFRLKKDQLRDFFRRLNLPQNQECFDNKLSSLRCW